MAVRCEGYDREREMSISSLADGFANKKSIMSDTVC
jgi:hypothetical protein